MAGDVVSTGTILGGTIRSRPDPRVLGGVRVIRIVVTILVGVQAVLPPGTCLCRLVTFGPITRPSHALALLAQLPVADEETCCSCPACRSADPAEKVPHGRAPTDDPAQKHHPVPTPSAPCSDCPVVSAGPAGRVTILTATEPAPFDLAVQFVAPSAGVATGRANRPHPSHPPAGTPLFVRHRALLI